MGILRLVIEYKASGLAFVLAAIYTKAFARIIYCCNVVHPVAGKQEIEAIK
ncbi:MAG: hypothetical protein AAFY76_06260 [Cyanobacteria bacterium J06649_11]